MAQERQSRLVEFRRGHARYTPTGRIAAGGMAEVWRGEARFEDGYVEPVAIKRVLPQLAQNPLYHRMLEDEARIGMLLRHPNIVRVFDAREVRGTYILVMELVDGVSLREINGRLMQRGAHMPLAAALHVGRELAKALEYAHEALDDFGRELSIVHRDVSPHNVLVDVHGHVKLMDFGLANSTANLAERDPAMIGGKFGYIAPELVLEKQSTHLLDLFALGVILWECVTGKRLFQGNGDIETVRKVARCHVPPASSVNGQVSAELDEVLCNLLTRDPAQRYQSARELGVDLDYLLEQYEPGSGKEEAAWLAQLQRSTRSRVPTTTQSGSQPSPHSIPSTSGVVPGSIPPPAPTMTRQTLSGSAPMPRMPRISDSFIDELDNISGETPTKR